MCFAQRSIAVQEYGRTNAQMVDALIQLGAQVETFALYRWQLPADTAPLRAAVRLLAARQTDLVLFTSGVQLEHLLMVAAEEHLAGEVLQALQQ